MRSFMCQLYLERGPEMAVLPLYLLTVAQLSQQPWTENETASWSATLLVFSLVTLLGPLSLILRKQLLNRQLLLPEPTAVPPAAGSPVNNLLTLLVIMAGSIATAYLIQQTRSILGFSEGNYFLLLAVIPAGFLHLFWRSQQTIYRQARPRHRREVWLSAGAIAAAIALSQPMASPEPTTYQNFFLYVLAGCISANAFALGPMTAAKAPQPTTSDQTETR